MSASSSSPGVELLTGSKTEKNKGLLHDAAAPVFCNIIAQADGETALRVEIDQQNILAFTGKPDPKAGTGACLTCSAFLVADCCDCSRHLVLPPSVLHRRNFTASLALNGEWIP